MTELPPDIYGQQLERTLRSEGKYQNLRSDPGNVAPHGIGGGTMCGITQATYDAYQESIDGPYKPVRYIPDTAVREIYRTRYWAIPSGPAVILQAGKPLLAQCAFDWGVHGGTKKARIFVQAAVRVFPDGVWGPKTLDAISRGDDSALASTLLRLRVAHHWVRCRGDDNARSVLRTAMVPDIKGVWPIFSAAATDWLNGWLTRVRSQATALGLPIHPSFAKGAEDGVYPSP